MKKWLLLFVVVDFIFVGLVLRLSTQNERKIASIQNESGMTEGQQRKFDLVKSMQFKADDQSLTLQTDRLQMICETSVNIQLKYIATNVAIAGNQPSIAHSFSCDEIKKNQSADSLTTSLEDFKFMHKNKQLVRDADSIQAFYIYSDEEFPADWKLAEISISGPSHFSINQYEIETAHSAGAFDFTITTISAR